MAQQNYKSHQILATTSYGGLSFGISFFCLAVDKLSHMDPMCQRSLWPVGPLPLLYAQEDSQYGVHRIKKSTVYRRFLYINAIGVSALNIVCTILVSMNQVPVVL
jgi:hypothetical protein